MNEENNRVGNQDVGNQDVKDYSYHFDPAKNNRSDNSFGGENNGQQERYTGGYQQNYGKTKRLGGGSSSMKYPYGIRGTWNSGKVSVLAIVAILCILALIIIFLMF